MLNGTTDSLASLDRKSLETLKRKELQTLCRRYNVKDKLLEITEGSEIAESKELSGTEIEWNDGHPTSTIREDQVEPNSNVQEERLVSLGEEPTAEPIDSPVRVPEAMDNPPTSFGEKDVWADEKTIMKTLSAANTVPSRPTRNHPIGMARSTSMAEKTGRKFDLKESLRRPLTYKPYTGKTGETYELMNLYRTFETIYNLVEFR